MESGGLRGIMDTLRWNSTE